VTLELTRLLSEFGYTLVEEMNRLGVIVDLSHTSDATATQALKHSKAPVIWSHSSARVVHDVPRNVPDAVLELIGTGEGQKDAVVMVRFGCFSARILISLANQRLTDQFRAHVRGGGRKRHYCCCCRPC